MSTISAGNTTTTAFKVTADTTGGLIFTTGGANTTALTLSNAQAATFSGAVSVTGNATISGNTVFTGSISAPNTFSFKNRIINGAMMIDQRNAGASVTPTTNDTFTLDRYKSKLTQSSKFSVQQNAGSVTSPVGFVNYLGITSLSAYSVISTDYFGIEQDVEGLNIADLGWGSANAQTVTLSFWVRSSLTGGFSGTLVNSGYSRNYGFTYTINSANTWEQKTITISGDITGTWLTTNGVGIRLSFCIGAGSNNLGAAGWSASPASGVTGSATSVVGTSGATFYITGVQLEIGSQATSFDFRPYGTEFNLCQRYYQVFGGSVGVYLGNGLMRDANNSDNYIKAWQVMRAQPTVTGTSTSNAFGIFTNGDTGGTFNGTVYGNQNQGALVRFAPASSLTSGQACIVSNTVGAYIAFSAEL